MLGMKTYNKSYIDACRPRVDAGLRAYLKQPGKAPSREFEQRFFNDQALLLDYMFVHRLTGIEGKDGNPLNEVRVLCNSILLNQGKLQFDKLPGWPNSAGSGIKLPPEKSLLKLKVGEEVRLDRSRLCAALRSFFRRDREEVLVRSAGLCDGTDKGEESGPRYLCSHVAASRLQGSGRFPALPNDQL